MTPAESETLSAIAQVVVYVLIPLAIAAWWWRRR